MLHLCCMMRSDAIEKDLSVPQHARKMDKYLSLVSGKTAQVFIASIRFTRAASKTDYRILQHMSKCIFVLHTSTSAALLLLSMATHNALQDAATHPAFTDDCNTCECTQCVAGHVYLMSHP